MKNYEIALFLHVIGFAGMFAGIGTELMLLRFLKRASDVQAVRVLMPISATAGKMIPLFAVLTFVAGAYMVEDVWQWDEPWIIVSVIAFSVLFAMGPLVNARKMQAIDTAAGEEEDGPIPDSLRALINDPALATSERTMTAATLGIVYLMVFKPDWGEALLAMAVAVAIGVATALPAWAPSREK